MSEAWAEIALTVLVNVLVPVGVGLWAARGSTAERGPRVAALAGAVAGAIARVVLFVALGERDPGALFGAVAGGFLWGGLFAYGAAWLASRQQRGDTGASSVQDPRGRLG